MHLSLLRETPEAFRVTQHSYIPQHAAQSDYRHPRVTIHALVTASRNAGGVSRHPALVYSQTCRIVELQATPSYRPCTCHCLEKRRRRFEAPSTRIFPNMPHSRKRCKQATYIGATCKKPPTCRTPNLCPSSTFMMSLFQEIHWSPD